MEPISSNTTHLTNFPFHPIWEVCDGMEYDNNKIKTLFHSQISLGMNLSPFFSHSNQLSSSVVCLYSFSVLGIATDSVFVASRWCSCVFYVVVFYPF